MTHRVGFSKLKSATKWGACLCPRGSARPFLVHVRSRLPAPSGGRTTMKDAYTIDELVKLGPLGRTLLYRAMGEQRLPSKTYGRRRYVLREDWLAFLRQEPPRDSHGELITDDLARGQNAPPLRPSSERPLSAEVESRSSGPWPPLRSRTRVRQRQGSKLGDGLKGKLGGRETGSE